MAALLFGGAACAAELRVAIPEHDDLVLTVPEEWKAKVRTPRANLPPTIAMVSGTHNELMVLITPIWPARSLTGDMPGAEEIRNMVSGAADIAKTKSLEDSLPLQEWRAPGMFGYYFSATDREPEPNGFKYLTQGAVGFRELRITFTILVNGEAKALNERALQVLGTMRRAPRRNTSS
ncbi:MAG: hypothetical protein V4724_02280 [Pseudomonadota bacterium]